MQKLLSIDWLTLNLRGSPETIQNVFIKELEYGTRQFKKVYKVFLKDLEVGTLVAFPYLSTLPSDYMQLKVTNELLYSDVLKQSLTALFAITNWIIEGVSRLDISLDFHTFKRGLEPSTFISRFAANKYYTMSRSTFRLMGDKTEENRYSYLSIGARKSDIRTILYNKTKEMREVKSKPWIEDCWKEVGLDPTREIWRLEFSIKGEAKHFTVKETGELLSVDYDSIFDDKFISRLFSVMYSRYFRFIKATAKTNHYREPAVDLLDIRYLKTARVQMSDRKCVDRSLRIFANRWVHEFNTDKRVWVQDRLVHGNYITGWLAHNGLLTYVQNRNNPLRV